MYLQFLKFVLCKIQKYGMHFSLNAKCDYIIHSAFARNPFHVITIIYNRYQNVLKLEPKHLAIFQLPRPLYINKCPSLFHGRSLIPNLQFK